MFENLLNIICAFDWLSPSAAFVQDLFNGPVSDFGIPADAGWGRREIKKLLTQYGVRVWGIMYNYDGTILMFTVPKTQAKWTYYLLQREGVPILYAPSEVAGSSRRGQGKAEQGSSPLDGIFGFLDKLDQGRF